MDKTKHKNRRRVEKELGDSEVIQEYKCPECGGIFVTSYGCGISLTYCVDCHYNEHDYDGD